MSVLAAFMVPHPPLIIPEVGRGGEDQIIDTTRAYDRVSEMVSEIKPETIIIISPHATMYSDYFHISPGDGARGSLGSFNAPQVTFDVKYDTDLVRKITDAAERAGIPAGTDGERVWTTGPWSLCISLIKNIQTTGLSG